MVLWEITLGTAYFLGLKRTYKLALKIQRKLISPKHPRIREFVQRRTRNVFDVALKVHLKIQERDIEVGRNVGNWILRWLDRMKPGAQIRGPPPTYTKAENTEITRHPNNSSHKNKPNGLPKHDAKNIDQQPSDRHLFTAVPRNVWSHSLPMFARMMRPTRTGGHNIQYRQYGAEFFMVKNGKFGEMARNDMRQWILHHQSSKWF